MKHFIRTCWWIGGLACLLMFFFPFPAFGQKASIKEVRVKGTDEGWKVSFRVENCFTEKMEEAIQTGTPTIFTFYVQLCQKRKWWRDRKVISIEFRHTIQYHPIRGEYQVTLGETDASFLTRSLEEAKGMMAEVKDLEVRPSSPLKPGVGTEFRIKAELDPVRLPLRLEYLLFFVSLWDFETDWYIEPHLP